MHRILSLATLVPLAITAGHAGRAKPLTLFRAVAIAPDGQRVASVEISDVPVDGRPPATLVIRDLAGHAAAVLPDCPHSPFSLKPAQGR